MKKFFKFGKDKKKTLTPQPSPTPSRASKASSAGISSGGYVVKEKDLGKLHKAVWNNDLDKVAQLAKKDASPFDKEHRTPLHFACALGYADIATELLEWRAKVSVSDNMNRTPLLKAAECGHDELVKLLLDHKADPNAKDKHEETCLHYATENEHVSMMKILLSSPKIFVDIKNQEGRTPLHIAAKKKSQRLCEILLNGGADIDTQDGRGMTVLMDSCHEGTAEMVKYFIQNRADVSRKNEKGWTAEDICQMERQEECLQILLQGSGRSQKQAPVQQAGMYGMPEDDEDEEYSEADGVMSRISEAAGGIESWAETDDDSELHPSQTNQKKIPNLKTIVQTNDDSWEESEDESDMPPPPPPAAPPPGQSPPSALPNKTENHEVQENDVDDSWGESEEDESLHHAGQAPLLANTTTVSAPVKSSEAKPEILETWADSDDNSEVVPNKTPASIVTSASRADTKRNELDSWAESDDESAITSKPTSPAQIGGSKEKRLNSWPDEDDDSAVLPVSTVVKSPAHNQVKNKVLDSWAESDDETEILPTHRSPESKMSQNSVNMINDTKQKSPTKMMKDLGLSDVESISDPELEDDVVLKNAKTAAQEDVANDSDWDSTVASEPSPRQPVLSARSIDKSPMVDEADADQLSKIQTNGMPREDYTSALPQNNTVVGSVDKVENSVITQVHNNLNVLTPKVENNVTQIVDDFDDSDSDVDDVDIPDIPTVPSEQLEEKAALKPTTPNTPVRSEEPQVCIQKTTLTEKTEIIADATSSSDITSNQPSQTTVSKEIAVDHKDIIIDDFEDCNNITIEMNTNTVRTLSDVPGVLGPTGLRGTNVDKDDDCLSYSSTEYEPSIHDELRTHTFSLPPSSDTTSTMRVHQQLREYQHRLEKERGARMSYESKFKSIDNERIELLQKVENLSKTKSQLEQEKIELDSKIRNIEFQNTEEIEKRKNSEVMYNKLKEQLLRKEEQYTDEVEAKQKCELSLRNLQMEIHTLQSAVKQAEEDKEDLQRQLNHERNTRLLQEQINEEQNKFQHTFNEDLNKSGSLAESISHHDMDDLKRQGLESSDKLKAELYATKMELERVKSRSKDDHEILMSENEELHQTIEKLKSDVKLNMEALEHASLQYNVEITAIKTDNTKLNADMESVRVNREKLEAEIISLKSRLDTTVLELEKAQEARNQLEKQGYSQQDDLSRQLERRDQDISHLKENNQVLIQRLGDAENKLNKLEGDLHNANANLIERTSQLSALQRELDQKKNTMDKLDENFRQTKEDNARLQVKIEASHEKVTALQQENVDMKKQLDEFHVRYMGEGRDDSDKFAIILSSLREDHEKQRLKLEEQNSSLSQNVTQLKEEIHNLKNQKQSQEQQVSRLQDQLADVSRTQAMSEASLSIANKMKEQLETENNQLKIKIENMQSKLDTAREKQIESQVKISEVTDRAEKAEKQHAVISQQLMNQSGHLQAASSDKSELGDTLRKLEIENAKLEASMKHEVQRVAMLQRELDDSHKVRSTLEAMMTNMKTSHVEMEHKMAEATVTKTLATQEAEDSQTLWENEVKSRSKLGLRIAQLEREKQDLASQLDEEKRSTRKAIDQRKKAEAKYDNEKSVISQLQKEVNLLKTHLRAAKKRLKELDTSDHVVNALRADFNRERNEMEHNLSALRKQLDSATNQLQCELDVKDQIEVKSRQLQVELDTLKSIEKSHAKLEKSKRKLEEDLNHYRTHINLNLVERKDMEKLKAEIEARSRAELNQKLEEVNKYLEEQAMARDKLDKMRDSNEVEMKKDFERTRNELLDELANLRSSYKQVLDQHESKATEAKRFKRMYESEMKKREHLNERLGKASNMASQAQNLHVMDNNMTSSSLPFENSWALRLTKTTPSEMTDPLGDRLKQELNRSIAKHMEKAPHVDSSVPMRSYDDSYIPTSLKSSGNSFL